MANPIPVLPDYGQNKEETKKIRRKNSSQTKPSQATVTITIATNKSELYCNTTPHFVIHILTVGSTKIVFPGVISPRASACKIIDMAIRSLTELAGFCDSNLTTTCAPCAIPSVTRFNCNNGVFPIKSKILEAIFFSPSVSEAAAAAAALMVVVMDRCCWVAVTAATTTGGDGVTKACATDDPPKEEEVVATTASRRRNNDLQEVVAVIIIVCFLIWFGWLCLWHPTTLRMCIFLCGELGVGHVATDFFWVLPWVR
jgi:hypothetical protein